MKLLHCDACGFDYMNAWGTCPRCALQQAATKFAALGTGEEPRVPFILTDYDQIIIRRHHMALMGWRRAHEGGQE